MPKGLPHKTIERRAAMLDIIRKQGTGWIDSTALAHRLNITKRSIQRNLEAMEEQGLIERKKLEGAKGNPHQFRATFRATNG